MKVVIIILAIIAAWFIYTGTNFDTLKNDYTAKFKGEKTVQLVTERRQERANEAKKALQY